MFSRAESLLRVHRDLQRSSAGVTNYRYLRTNRINLNDTGEGVSRVIAFLNPHANGFSNWPRMPARHERFTMAAVERWRFLSYRRNAGSASPWRRQSPSTMASCIAIHAP